MITSDPLGRPELKILDSFCWDGSLENKGLNESGPIELTLLNPQSESEQAEAITSTVRSMHFNTQYIALYGKIAYHKLPQEIVTSSISVNCRIAYTQR